MYPSLTTSRRSLFLCPNYSNYKNIWYSISKSKHITINVSELEYTQLLKLAEKDRRKLAEFVALVVLDATESARVEAMRVNDGYIKKADIKTGFKILQNKN